ncbi:NACHT, LRR and PYD domains-containing protein 3-like [Conger conger]|uniref:NACHT, LRR and PYD domains-containing protein 3-like n=1 Tax=Conger conger TaxID=82655 RepID=UPI002A59BFFB|nr:NACHT, LRR and PYD domains-containing protein 3-like [Conger conger]
MAAGPLAVSLPDPEGSTCRSLRELRVCLVDQLEDHIGSLVEQLLLRDVFTRDDREDVLCQPGPRARVRKVLDILDCKGEEAASSFLSLYRRLQEAGREPVRQAQSAGYRKVIEKHKQTLKRRSECMLFYNTRHGEKILFSEHYVNLLLVKGHCSLEVKKHEILAFGQQRISLQQKAQEQRVIKPQQLFSDLTHSQAAKKILVTGVAGIGKTVLVQKILCDFGNNQGYFNFDFVIHLTFRDLNLITKPVSLRELVLRKNRHLAKDLDSVFANYEKLLIVLDGFDEFKHYRACDTEEFVTEEDEEGEVVQIVSSLMRGELLPEASVLLTSRPTAIGYIPIGCIDCFALITGFSMAEIKDFFIKYFQDEGLALRMFEVVRANELMLTLCFIPGFCYIVCSILRDSDGFSTKSPKTMTDIYTHYLVALLRSHTQNRAGSPHDLGNEEECLEQLSDTVLNLGRLAYQKLLAHDTLFYSCSPDVRQLAGNNLVSTFLDKTTVQEPGCSEDVYSFTHFTIQEFFAALYYVLEDHPSPDILESEVVLGREVSTGYLDLFRRFLSGLLSERNQQLLSRHVRMGRSRKADSYLPWLLGDIRSLCENGAFILNHLHCFFEQQDVSLALELNPTSLRINVSDDNLAPMDYGVIKYFLNLKCGDIHELDLTGTNVSTKSLMDLKPYLFRCQKLWLGENNLDTEAMQILAEVLQSTRNMVQLGLGWTNIGDEEFLVLAEGLRTNEVLQGLWLEGNNITFRGLSAVADFIPFSVRKIIVIWNNVSEEEAEKLNNRECVIADFSNDDTWIGWGDWVLQRCEVSNNEKLVTFLNKVCNISIYCMEIGWVETFYSKLTEMIRTRIDVCSEDDIRRKLVKFLDILTV